MYLNLKCSLWNRAVFVSALHLLKPSLTWSVTDEACSWHLPRSLNQNWHVLRRLLQSIHLGRLQIRVQKNAYAFCTEVFYSRKYVHLLLANQQIEAQLAANERRQHSSVHMTWVSLEFHVQPGREMVAAGYCLYGSSCCLVLSVGDGVSSFTLDPSMGEFLLTAPNLKVIPYSCPHPLGVWTNSSTSMSRCEV